MVVRKFVGENETYWYLDNMGSIRRFIYDYILWLGGWVKPHWDGATYSTRFELNASNWKDPFPIRIFGILTIQPFGFTLWRRKHYYCWHWNGNFCTIFKFEKHSIYRSPDGTPQHADVWYKNCPSEIKEGVRRPTECGGIRAV